MSKLASGASQQWDGHGKVVFVANAESHRSVTNLSESLTRAGFDPKSVVSGINSSTVHAPPTGKESVKWMCSVVTSTHIGPASIRPTPPNTNNTINGDSIRAYPSFISGLQSPLENICLGIALGVTRQLAVNASTPLMISPIDLITSVGLLAVSLLSARRIPHSANSRNRVAI